jgi:spore coat polysaccharide biosynthesis predicted glycosyltransferase SpsG/RimJ/RimL family protein N-acetyltransferase
MNLNGGETGRTLLISDELPFLPFSGASSRLHDEAYGVTSSQADAVQTKRLASSLGVETVFLDHYWLGTQWIEFLRLDYQVVAISDGQRHQSADQIIDYGFDASISNYEQASANGAKLHLGSLFAPISKEYNRFRWSPKPEPRDIDKCLVSLGGSGKSRNIAFIQNHILRRLPKVQFLDPLVFSYAGQSAAVEPTAKIKVSPVSLAERFDAADFAVVSAGVTMYDMLASGTQGLVKLSAENQKPAFDIAVREGYVRAFSNSRLTYDLSQIAQVCRTPELQLESWLAGRSLVDSLGAQRVASRVLEVTSPKTNMRPYEWQDLPILFRLRNQPSSVAGFFGQSRVTASEHLKWFDEFMVGKDKGWIFEEMGLPVGQCRLSSSDEGLTLSYSILEEYQGRGLSTKMLASLFAIVSSPKPVWAKVRTENKASMKALKSSSFEVYSRDPEKVVMVRWIR